MNKKEELKEFNRIYAEVKKLRNSTLSENFDEVDNEIDRLVMNAYIAGMKAEARLIEAELNKGKKKVK